MMQNITLPGIFNYKFSIKKEKWMDESKKGKKLDRTWRPTLITSHINVKFIISSLHK